LLLCNNFNDALTYVLFLVLNLVNPVVLYIILSTWPASCHVFVKWPVGQEAVGPRWATHLDSFLVMSRQW